MAILVVAQAPGMTAEEDAALAAGLDLAGSPPAGGGSPRGRTWRRELTAAPRLRRCGSREVLSISWCHAVTLTPADQRRCGRIGHAGQVGALIACVRLRRCHRGTPGLGQLAVMIAPGTAGGTGR